MSLQLDSLVTDLILQASPRIDQKTLIDGLGGEDALEGKQLLDVDRLDPRAEMELSPSMPFRRRGERRLMIIDEHTVIPRADPQADPWIKTDLRLAKEALIATCQKLPVRLGRLFVLGSWGDAVLVARNVRDLRAICLVPWALDPQVDVAGKRLQTSLSQKEFEAKILAYEKRLEELDDQQIIDSLSGVFFERRGDMVVVSVLEADGTWDQRKSLAMETQLAAVDRFSRVPGARVKEAEATHPKREAIAEQLASRRSEQSSSPERPRSNRPAQQEEQRQPPVRILFLAANPSDQTRLALTREVEQFSERLRATDHRDAYKIEQHWEVEPKKLQGLLLRHKPQIVHFSGHGTSTGELAFQDVDGTTVALSVEHLAKVFAILNKYVRCVVLNACFSRPQATAIVKNVDIVIGMGDAIRDTDSIAFAGAFYEALGYGEDVKTAFELARNAIGIESRKAQSKRDVEADRDVVVKDDRRDLAVSEVPELLTRPGVDPSLVRFVDLV